MRYLLIVLLGCLPLLAGAVEFDDATGRLPLGRYMQVYEDHEGSASIAQVSAGAFAKRFHAHHDEVLNAGYSTSVFWLRVDLAYAATPSPAPRQWLLELAYPPLDHLELYLPDAQGTYRLAQRTGDALPYASRQIRQNNYLFELPLRPGQATTAYLRLQSEGSIQAPLTLWSAQAYLEDQPTRLYVLGMIYGVLLVMLVYNLFLYLSVRDVSYLYYILYIASFGLYQVSVNGAGIAYFWPDSPWWANAATPFFIGAAGLFGCQFARHFLQLGNLSRGLDRLLKGLMAGGALVMVLAVTLRYGVALRMATLLALLFTVSVFSAGLYAWWRGLRVARWFIIAWTAFLVGGLVNTLMVLGYLPNLFITMYASQLGAALEVALLSLALADRINSLREQQAQALRETGRTLEQMNLQLARSNRLKDEFLATVTHELRTPMNGVIGSLELLHTLPMSAEQAQYHRTATGSAQDMMAMVDDILILTELQAGRLRNHGMAFSLRRLLQELRAGYASQALAKGLYLSLDIPADLPDSLVGDAQKLARCLACLVDNGLKFTHQGGVTVQARGRRTGPDSLALSLTVSDSGIGFDDLDQAVLYQRFFQVDGSMTRRYGGLGIGLSICRQLSELIGATLSHESTQGLGSRFELTLPLAVAQVQAPPARAASRLDRF
ncbi:hybrid sensor histidine kinase/response regulator [Pseudomonas soli]|jgi:signal transduction histidine kinase|uniref:histidine kinase n=1 Tax=Pseudomonas soli TaxID=1306993 RepID=A0A1H9SEU8_9PSED|nr:MULTISPECIES: hybrid sensor histidine kinase/response regulator [Pseudomonas]AUY34248.1 hybrid sensor histidine kinase/response regulator [Pseudomonas sp. PONIH3]MDT3715411.1 7TM diverse intracellular signaling domain-containing protein [Pseudomonas soli]MDT3732297.1 7TM diverse intracellular signaling domain-containing protein [Pseudomonas soli]MEE1881802.1 7TM diverse intracellular signaling domain-containing protein [Pseudomonas soli]NBK39689.1 hybrid sensor histidine kinase/response reg